MSIMDAARTAAARPTYKELKAENERLQARNDGIADALKTRGLFAFEHIDGTFTINDR